MTPRKTAASEASLELQETKEVGAYDFSKVREWAVVAKEIKALQESGVNGLEICEKLQVSYVLVNQAILQSYKMVIDSVEGFARQEKMRLGIDG
jgi:TolB-like protein